MKKTLLFLASLMMALPLMGQTVHVDPGLFAENYGLSLNQTLASGEVVVRYVPDSVYIRDDLGNLADVIGTYGIPYTADSVIVDTGLVAPTDADDLSVTFVMVYSERMASLLFWVQVLDADIVVGSAQPWQDDAVELYLDPDNSDDPAGTLANGDVQIRFWPVQNEAGDAIVDVASNRDYVDATIEEITGGYEIAAIIPFEADAIDQYPYPNGIMGFEVQVIDDDDGDNRDTMVSYSNAANNFFNDPTLWHDAFLLKYVDIQMGTPTIDGSSADWDAVSSHGLFYIVNGEDGLAEWTGVSDASAQWKAVWDNDALYVLTEVLADDDITSGVHADDETSPEFNDFRVDRLEILIDMDNDKRITSSRDDYDETETLLRAPWDGPLREFRGLDRGHDYDGTFLDAARTVGANSWFVEWALPWQERGQNFPNEFVGFDARMGDMDGADATTTETFMAWYEATNASVQNNVAQFGTLRLNVGPTAVESWQDLDR